jgi:hypothetical protein
VARREERFGKRVRREIAARDEELFREALAILAARIRAARTGRAPKLRRVRSRCKRRNVATDERTRLIFEAIINAARIERDRTRKGARERCAFERHAVETRTARRIGTARQARAALRAEHAELRRLERRAPSRSSAAERAAESDDEVLTNFPPQFHALFRRVKGSIKATARRTRTEAFAHYLEEHPGEAYEAIELDVERAFRAEERAHHQKKAPRRRAAVDESVPF